MNQCFTNSNAAFRIFKAGILSGALLLAKGANAQRILQFGSDNSLERQISPSVKPMTATLQLIKDGQALPTAVSVTASFNAQQFTGVPGNLTGTGLQFGACQNTAGTTANGQSPWTLLETISNPAPDLFSADAKATGIDASENYAFSIFATTRPLTGLPTNGRYLMGQLKLSFSKAVSNPVLHLVGLGGTAGALGVTTELELVNEGFSLQKLSGNNNLEVGNRDIRNSAINPDASSYTGAASGSISVNGKDITELVFNVFMKGDGAAANWEHMNQYNGDRWLIGLSLNANNLPATSLPLPIYVTNFNVTHEEACSATIRWKTSTEIGVSEMFLEHSTDGVNFTDIYARPCAGTSEGDYYSFTYRHATSGFNYFRVRTRDILSDSNLGAIVRVLVTCDERPIEVFPNPAQEFIKINGAAAGQTVQISNIFGKVQLLKKLNSTDESLSLEGLQTGIYLLIVSNEQGQELSRTRINKQ